MIRPTASVIRIATCVAVCLAFGSPVLAQVSAVEGNWGCRANIDGTRAGILTVYAGSYGYASANYASKASGTGTATLYSDGLQFVDGNLVLGAGIEVGMLGYDEDGRDILVLSTREKPILTCRPR